MDNLTKLSWILWFVLSVISLVYVIFAAKTFNALGEIEDLFDNTKDSEEKDQIESNLRGGRAACVLSIMAVIVYAGYTLLYTIKDWATSGALSGSLYGILMTSSLYSSAFMLLTGVVLQANDRLVEVNADAMDESGWHRDNTTAFALAYLLTGIYAISFIFYIVRGIRSASNPTAPTQPISFRMGEGRHSAGL